MRMKRGQPSLDSVKGYKFEDHGSVLRFPIMIALTPSSSMRRPTSRLKSAEYSCTRMPYLFSKMENIRMTKKIITYSCSIWERNSTICSNSLSFTKCTNLIFFNKPPSDYYGALVLASPSSTAYASAPAASAPAPTAVDSYYLYSSIFEMAAVRRCRATVQSLPPLKLRAISSGGNIRRASPRVVSEASTIEHNSAVCQARTS